MFKTSVLSIDLTHIGKDQRVVLKSFFMLTISSSLCPASFGFERQNLLASDSTSVTRLGDLLDFGQIL